MPNRSKSLCRSLQLMQQRSADLFPSRGCGGQSSRIFPFYVLPFAAALCCSLTVSAVAQELSSVQTSSPPPGTPQGVQKSLAPERGSSDAKKQQEIPKPRHELSRRLRSVYLQHRRPAAFLRELRLWGAEQTARLYRRAASPYPHVYNAIGISPYSAEKVRPRRIRRPRRSRPRFEASLEKWPLFTRHRWWAEV